MKKEIIINAALNEVRIAITENGDLAELFIEIPDKERLVGNIYMGRVGKVIQGMNAAFIDIGIGQDGFLHFSDVDSSLEDSFITEEEDDDEDDDEPFLPPIADAKLTDSAAMALRKSPSKSKKSVKPCRRSLPNVRAWCRLVSNPSKISSFRSCARHTPPKACA